MLPQCWNVTQENKLETIKPRTWGYNKLWNKMETPCFQKWRIKQLFGGSIFSASMNEEMRVVLHPLDHLKSVFGDYFEIHVCALAILNIRITVRPQSERHYFAAKPELAWQALFPLPAHKQRLSRQAKPECTWVKYLCYWQIQTNYKSSMHWVPWCQCSFT